MSWLLFNPIEAIFGFFILQEISMVNRDDDIKDVESHINTLKFLLSDDLKLSKNSSNL